MNQTTTSGTERKLPSPVTLTDSAAAFITKQMAADPAATGFRLGLSKKGCGDGKYVAELAHAAQPTDMVVTDNGITLYIDLQAQLRMFGMTVDYEETPFQSGLVFINPNEKGRCGCGESPVF